MTVLPIVERELRVAARRGATYWTRLVVALAAVLVGAAVFMFTFGLPPVQTGRYAFEGLAGVMLLHCLAYGRRSTADCLSVEKREGTLGLLFLTDLKGHDVVLGKLAATSVSGFYGLLAVFPVLALPLLLGGISSGELWRVALVLVDTFLFSLAIGMLSSALSRDLRRAMAANLLLLLFFMAVPPACAFALTYFAPGLPKLPQLFFSCPVYSFFLCDDTQYRSGPNHFWWSLGMIHGLTWLLLVVAGWIVPRSWQDRPARAGRSRWRELWRAWSYGPLAEQGAFRKRALDANAFYWLAARARLKPVHVWTFFACLAVWWLAGWLGFGRLWLDSSITVLTALMLNLALKVWLTIEAGQQLADARQAGAFELLLSVPLTVRDILRGQLLALRRQFMWPVVLLLGAGLCLVVALRRNGAGMQTQATWLAGLCMLVADLIALGWVATWRALVARSHNLATIGTLLRVLVLPWLLFGVVMAVGSMWSALGPGKEWSPGWRLTLGLWVGLGLAADLVFGLTAWWQLRTRFRELALQRFNLAPSGFRRWFGARQAARADAQRARAARQEDPLDKPQRRDERREDGGRGISASFATLRLKSLFGRPRRRLALLGCLMLLAVGAAALNLRSRSSLPPPVVASLNQSNGPVRVFFAPESAGLILPDDSLWLWGKMGPTTPSRAAVPEQVATNRNWTQVAAGYGYWVGLNQAGSLWQWGPRHLNPNQPAASSLEPTLVDSNHIWIGVAAGMAHWVALRHDGTLWAWGDNSQSQLGNGPGPNRTNLVQVGTKADWAAVCGTWYGTLALRQDGTLWAWGSVHVIATVTGTVVTLHSLPDPTRICLESNWTGFVTGPFQPLVQNRAGELWEPFHAPPSAELPAAASFRLIASRAAPGRFATAFCGEMKIYELRPDGSLWEKAQPLSFYTGTRAGEWQRVGHRADWVGLWSGHCTALGLTADGTLWTWGIDVGREPAADFLSRLKLARSWLTSLVGPGPPPMLTGTVPAYEKQPRPLMRLVSNYAVAPAGTRGARR